MKTTVIIVGKEEPDFYMCKINRILFARIDLSKNIKFEEPRLYFF